jgi:hypothetical protein
MADTQILTKRMAISKTNAQMVGMVAGAAFVTIFCLVAAHAVWSQNAYQARVISAKKKAHQQLVKNLSAYNDLASSYKAFVSTPNNVIGGVSSGTGDNDGDNAKIILDALPPSYDFPALTSSLEKILDDRSLKVTSITGTDDQVAQQGNTTSPTPQPISMPFTFSISNADYNSVSQLVTALQQSIRPIQIDSIDLTGGAKDMEVTVNAHTYYQPGKSVNISKKVVK